MRKIAETVLNDFSRGMVVRIAVAISLCSLLTTSEVMARQWFVEPEVFISAGYEDNPYLVSELEDETGDVPPEADRSGSRGFGYLGGALRLGSEAESDLMAFDLSASARRYNDSELDTERAGAAFVYSKIGQVHDWNLDTGYRKSTSISSFLGDPDSGIILDDVGRFRDDVDQEEIFFVPSLTSRFSTLWLGQFGLGYRNITFDEPEDTNTEYEDFLINAEIRRIVSERLSVSGFANALFYRPTEDVPLGATLEEDAFDFQLGFNYLVNERMSVIASAGPGNLDSRVSGSSRTIEISDSAPIYDVTVVYSGERNSVTVNFRSAYESVRGRGLTFSQRFSIGYSRPGTWGGDLGVRASYLERDPSLGEILDRNYFFFSPSMSWDVNQFLALSLSIHYREQEIIDIITDASDRANSTAVIIGASYVWGRKLLKQ